jgi:hypothetical protein
METKILFSLLWYIWTLFYCIMFLKLLTSPDNLGKMEIGAVLYPLGLYCSVLPQPVYSISNTHLNSGRLTWQTV